MPVRIPRKPFANYKWRWAEVTPSEGLNNPLRLLGVLRAMRAHEGKQKSTVDIGPDLARVEAATNQLTGEQVHLARVGPRNLFRNSDRYWKALGLLDPRSQNITLTTFGRRVADGDITQNEFAVSVVRRLELPNRNIEPDLNPWLRAGLRIKPLELILDILRELSRSYGYAATFITPFELRRIVIPLAGESAPVAEHAEAIDLFRRGRLPIEEFPDCTPGSNDRRMAREFLLFLHYYGFCNLEPGASNDQDRFVAAEIQLRELEAIDQLPDAGPYEETANLVRNNPVISESERRRILVEVLSRPQQTAFRRLVLRRFNGTCLLTGETSEIVLEACHVIPVKHRGTDSVANGLCLRSDIHILFDSNHIRFNPEGTVHYSPLVRNSPSYRDLPARVDFPPFVSAESLAWRYQYY